MRLDVNTLRLYRVYAKSPAASLEAKNVCEAMPLTMRSAHRPNIYHSQAYRGGTRGSFGEIQIAGVEAGIHDGPSYRRPSEACREAFVRAMLTDVPPAPPQAAQIRAVNSGMMTAAE
jgi:hypothetical protein